MMLGFFLRSKVRSLIYLVFIVVIALFMILLVDGKHLVLSEAERRVVPFLVFAAACIALVLLTGFLASLKQLRLSANPSVEAMNQAAREGVDSYEVLRRTGQEKADETLQSLTMVRVVCPSCGEPTRGWDDQQVTCPACGDNFVVVR